MKQHLLEVKELHNYQYKQELKNNNQESYFTSIAKMIMAIYQRRVTLSKRKRKDDHDKNVLVAYHCVD